jgi:hypothetical protein
MKCSNQNCGAELIASARFCAVCGQPVIANGSSSVEFQNFVYLLNEEQLRRVETRAIQPPYGSIGITLVDGFVSKVHYPSASQTEQGNVFGDFLRKAMEFGAGLVGQKKQEIKTYVMMDLRDLPIATYSHPLTIPGVQNAHLRFKFWVDATAGGEAASAKLGLFFQRCVGNNNSLTLDDLKRLAASQIERIIGMRDVATLAATGSELRSIADELERAIGISTTCDFVKGAHLERRTYEVSAVSAGASCPKCGNACQVSDKFCDNCGASIRAAGLVSAQSYLRSADGEDVTIKVSLLVSEAPGSSVSLPSEAEIREALFEQVSVLIATQSSTSLRQPATLDQLSNRLSKVFEEKWFGLIGEVVITDVRTVREDWFYKADSLLKEELRKVETNRQFLTLDEKDIDYGEAAFAIALRRSRQNDTQQLEMRQAALDAKRQTAGLDIGEHVLDSDTALKREAVDDETRKIRLDRELDREKIDDEASKVRLERERQHVAREDILHKENLARVRSNENDQLGHERIQERDQLEHQVSLEKRSLTHDIDVNETTAEAQSRARRRNVSDDLHENEQRLGGEALRREQQIRLDTKEGEELLRLKAEERTKLGHIEEDIQDRQEKRQIDKLQAMADLERRMAEQDHAQELAKSAQEYQNEASKREALRGLDPAQILAMQVAELARLAGGGQASTDVVKSLAESQAAAASAAAAAAGTNIKEEMYRQMLEAQRSSGEQVSQAYRESAQHSVAASERAMESMMQVSKIAAAQGTEGYKEAAKISQSVNEKSMDSMSKVATAAAGKKSAEEKVPKNDSSDTPCVNEQCNYTFKGKVGKFCPKCGAEQVE